MRLAKTLEWMIYYCQGSSSRITLDNAGRTLLLLPKLLEMKDFTDDDKFNRWFGYYQRVGEELGLWALDEVIQWVREEKNESHQDCCTCKNLNCCSAESPYQGCKNFDRWE